MKKVTLRMQIDATMWCEDWDDAEMIEYIIQYFSGEPPDGWSREGVVDQESDNTVIECKVEDES